MHAKVYDRTVQPVVYESLAKTSDEWLSRIYSILLQIDCLQLTAVYCNQRVASWSVCFACAFVQFHECRWRVKELRCHASSIMSRSGDLTWRARNVADIRDEVRKNVKPKGAVVREVRDVYCVSLSSDMQFTALALVKNCGLVSTAFSAHEFANLCYFVSFVCFSCTPPVRGSGSYQDSSPRQLQDVAL